jgi:hypothetical protein
VSEHPLGGCADCLELQIRMGETVLPQSMIAGWASTIVDGRAVCLQHAQNRIRKSWDEEIKKATELET